MGAPAKIDLWHINRFLQWFEQRMWQSLYELHSEPPKLRKPVLICDGCWKPIPPAHCYCTAVYTADSNHKSKAAQAGQICDGCWKPIPPVHCYCTAVYTADSNHKSKGAQASSIMWWMLETHASCTLFLCALRISSLKQSRFLCKPSRNGWGEVKAYTCCMFIQDACTKTLHGPCKSLKD